ncbi:hypothetical protein [Streptomyces sp. NPDC089795]
MDERLGLRGVRVPLVEGSLALGGEGGVLGLVGGVSRVGVLGHASHDV